MKTSQTPPIGTAAVETVKVRPTRREDLSDLQRVLDTTGLFPSEMLPEMLGDSLSQGLECAPEAGHDIWLSCVTKGVVAGFCMAVPEKLTEGTWNMLAIAVLSEKQGDGLGSLILRELEAALRDRKQRLLIVDTSGSDAFAATRSFYRKNGYVEEARIRDFWAPGDDKIVLWKAL